MSSYGCRLVRCAGAGGGLAARGSQRLLRPLLEGADADWSYSLADYVSAVIIVYIA